MRDVFDGFPIAGSPNESQTEDDLIWPVLLQLGWKASLRQQNLSAQGREDVPDGLLFTDAAAKDRANGFTEEWKRYAFGLAVVESKRWLRPLDRRSGRRGEASAPDCPEPQFEANSFVTVTFRPNPEVRAKAEERPVDRVAGEVRLLQVMSGEMTRQRLQEALGLKHEDHFRKAYLILALRSGLIEMTIPDKPRSSKQRYRLTAAGSEYLKQTRKSQ